MHNPSNAIITIVGFLIAYGAVGTMDIDPTASVVQMTAIAFAGLGLMFAGVNGLTHSK